MLAEEKRILIEWFLNFLNCDLNKISKPEKRMLTSDAINIVYGMVSWVVNRKSDALVPPDSGGGVKPLEEADDLWVRENRLESCQKHLKGFLSAMLQKIETSKGSATEWRQEFPKPISSDEWETNLKIKIQTPVIEFDSQLVRIEDGKEKPLFRLKEDSRLNAPLQLAFRATKDEETMLLYFYQALEGIPIGALRQCPECDRYYLHLNKKSKKLSRKHRVYCSNPCASRAISKSTLNELKTDPAAYEEYLANEADRGRRSYVKKTERGNPTRRPYKYKNSTEE